MNKSSLDFLNVSKENIWSYKQNHPELVVQDLSLFINDNSFSVIEFEEAVRKSLLSRGVNKWLKVRRDLIKYKIFIRDEIKALHAKIINLKEAMNITYVYQKELTNNFTERLLRRYLVYIDIRTHYIVHKEILKRLMKIRRDLKRMCMTERFQTWQGKSLDDMTTIKMEGNNGFQ